MKRVRPILTGIIIAVSAFMVVLSLAAGIIGFDPDMRWGLLRRATLFVGSAGLLGLGFLHLIRVLDRRLISKRQDSVGIEPDLHELSETLPEGSSTDPSRIPSISDANAKWFRFLAIAFAILLVLIVYVGLQSAWRWTQWQSQGSTYWMLGEAFTRGKTHLPIVPDPRLALLENPYTASARSGLDAIGNLSYYDGKYYLYWGRTPAVILGVLNLLGFPQIADSVVGFASIFFVFLFSGLIILQFRDAYFKTVPLYLLASAWIVVGTIHPMLWFQNGQGILTASIAAGQAFLIAGLYFIVKELTSTSPGIPGYAAAGALWGLAIASRITTIMPVAVFVLGVSIISIWRAKLLDKKRFGLLTVISLLAPLGLVLACYGWYNFVRFGNPFNTGFVYQFVEFDKRAELARGTLFSLRYLIPNALYYLLAPIRVFSRFPYVRPVYYQHPLFERILANFDLLPSKYRVEDAVGLIFAAPTLLYGLVLARKWLMGEIPVRFQHDEGGPDSAGIPMVSEGTLGILMMFAGMAAAVPDVLYQWSVTRYQLDFVPLLTLVAILGLWRSYSDTRPFPIGSRLAKATILLIVTMGTLVSLLLAVSGAGSNFDDLNPELLSRLIELLPHW